MRTAVLAAVAGLAALIVGLPLTLVAAVGAGGDAAARTTDPGAAVAGSCAVILPGRTVHLDAGQMDNARVVAAVAGQRRLPQRAVVIGLATAMQESSLRNVNHGDLAGPNSRGLFQQQPADYPGVDLSDPTSAARAFYDRLDGVPGWPRMPVAQAAQAVQHSAFPTLHARWQRIAEVLAAAFDGEPRAGIRCTPADPSAGPGGPAAVRVAAALAAARLQLGQPYVWGGGDRAGPTGGTDHVLPPGFDCSGLVLYAWARAGLSLPHSSRLQYQAGLHVPVGAAQPGDLIFLGSDPGDAATIHHVALVYAPGLIIEAQTFGVPVHIRAFAGAREPEIMPYVVRLVR